MTRGLQEAGIRFESGLLAGRPPRVVFSVPRANLEQAREIVAAVQEARLGDDSLGDDEHATLVPEGADRFPWPELRIALGLIVFHLAILVWTRGPFPVGRLFFERALLASGETLHQPWRLLTSLFLHVDLRHVLWNGASMVVFAVPLLTGLGRIRALSTYLASGVGGGLAALALASAGTHFLGSSGAVAGLFGAWITLTMRRARHATLSRRARLRTMGIALLVLPSLLTPTTSAGQRVSVESHVGGLLTGLLIGAVVSGGLLASARDDPREPSS